MKPTVVVLAHNEEPNLGACLSSVIPLDGDIFVVDSGSEDNTQQIAAHYGATVIEHKFETHATQWNWALQNLALTTTWVLAIDADQRLTPELLLEIKRLPEDLPVDGVFLRRRQVFRGRWIRHGGYYPKHLLKLFRRDRVVIDPVDLVDHHFNVHGPTATLRHDLIEENRREDCISFWIEKHNRYARLLAQEERARRVGTFPSYVEPALLGNSDQRTAWRKRIWRRLPLYVRPALYFLYRYIIRLGVLDGKEGYIFHFLHAYWFRLLVDINREELERTLERRPSGEPWPASMNPRRRR
jgi:glycosyltransferase involved in cell wall biosynthesis